MLVGYGAQKQSMSKSLNSLRIIIFVNRIIMNDNCEIKNSAERGEGLYAKKNFLKGQVVLVCEIEKAFCQNGVHASQIQMDKWHTFTLLGRSINHSCDPNVGIAFDGENWLYVAFKDIREGDELAYDYAMANYVIENMPQCLCGTPACRKMIKGFQNLPEDKKRYYSGFFAPFLQKILDLETLNK